MFLVCRLPSSNKYIQATVEKYDLTQLMNSDLSIFTSMYKMYKLFYCFLN